MTRSTMHRWLSSMTSRTFHRIGLAVLASLVAAVAFSGCDYQSEPVQNGFNLPLTGNRK